MSNQPYETIIPGTLRGLYGGGIDFDLLSHLKNEADSTSELGRRKLWCMRDRMFQTGQILEATVITFMLERKHFPDRIDYLKLAAEAELGRKAREQLSDQRGPLLEDILRAAQEIFLFNLLLKRVGEFTEPYPSCILHNIDSAFLSIAVEHDRHNPHKKNDWRDFLVTVNFKVEHGPTPAPLIFHSGGRDYLPMISEGERFSPPRDGVSLSLLNDILHLLIEGARRDGAQIDYETDQPT